MKMLFIFCAITLSFSQSFAAEGVEGQHVLMTPYELEVQDIARKRLYPGGRDEEPLKVLSQLPQPVRKMGPATEAPEEDAADHD